MISRFLLRRFVAVLTCLLLPARAETPAVSVTEVDLARYAGKWYEIASFPMFFQRNCVGDTTAEYALTPEGDVSVTNRCRTADGFDEAKGTATIVDGSRNARLKVSFFWPFRSDYWIFGLDADYRWAVVGKDSRFGARRVVLGQLGDGFEKARTQGVIQVLGRGVGCGGQQALQ